MSIEKILLDEAAGMADSLEGGVAALEAELMAVEQRRIETEAELKTAKQARTRLLDFRPRLGHGYQCPHCWLQNETQSALSPMATVTSDEILRCHACGSEYVIPVAAP
jgi:primosomal protein N'